MEYIQNYQIKSDSLYLAYKLAIIIRKTWDNSWVCKPASII